MLNNLSILKILIYVGLKFHATIEYGIWKSQVPPKTEGLQDMSYSDLPVQPGLPILVGFLAASLGSLMGPSLYYVSAFVDFFRPTHYVSINTVMNASKNYHLLNPPNKYLWWSNIGMVPSPSQSHFLVLYRTYEFINDESRK